LDGDIEMAKPREYIDTIRGRAYFVKTCTEDKYGNWDDHWSTIAGEFVIHEGKNHHVYKIGYKQKPYDEDLDRGTGIGRYPAMWDLK